MSSCRCRVFGLILTGIYLLTGCSFTPPLTTTPLPAASATIQATRPTPSPSDWRQLQPGLEQRTLHIVENGMRVEALHILRLEPALFQFNIAYDPQGQTLEAWQAQTGALIVINGGYFRLAGEQYYPNGLTVLNGTPIGSSYGDFGGMVAVTNAGIELRWLAQQPYNPNEPLSAALQSFPILVKPGGELGFPAEHEDHIAARRTVIAQDQAGRILLILAPGGNLTLHQLSAELTNSDLALDLAINLDGGPSSGLLLANPREEIPASSLLPIVITVDAR